MPKLSADQILEHMETLSGEYETARQISNKYQPLYEMLRDECLVNMQAGKFDEFASETVKDLLQTVAISKLTIAEKEAIVRAENPELADKCRRAEIIMKRIERLFDMYNSQLIWHMSANKQERAISGYRP